MRFFSKIVFICNCCFIIAAIFQYIELTSRKSGNYEAAIPFPGLESSIVLLGYWVAIFLNVIFNILVLVFLIKRKSPAPKWIIWFNFLLLPAQVYYFELYKW